MKFVLVLLGMLAPALVLQAQDDKETLKRDLLKEVEKRLKNDEERLLKDIERVLDEELNRAGKGPAPRPVPKAELPRPVTPKQDAPNRKARGYLGVKLGDLTDEEKKDLGVKGLRVVEVVEGGPAAKAGIVSDDIITQVDGRVLESMQELAPIMAAAAPGTTVKFEVLRNGKRKTVPVVLGVYPGDSGPAPVEPPKEQGKSEEDLRERVKKFLDKKEAPKEAPKGKKPAAPKGDEEDFLAIDEEVFEQFKGIFEQFGMEPEQFFDKGNDGKYRLNDQMREMFKNFNLERFKGLLPRGEEEELVPTPPPAPRKVEPKKVEPKKAEPPVPPPAPVMRPWLGLEPDEVPEELRAQLDVEEGALLVAGVLPGSPAEKAGLKKNDILTKIDGTPVKGEDSLAKFMAGAKPGQEATLTVLRKAKELTIKVVIGERRQ